MSDKFIHDQVVSSADSSSTTQIETEDDCASSARSSSDAHADEGRTTKNYSTQTKVRATEGDASLSQGIIYDSRSDFQKAIECYEKSLNIAREACLLYTSPSPRDQRGSRMPSSA